MLEYAHERLNGTKFYGIQCFFISFFGATKIKSIIEVGFIALVSKYSFNKSIENIKWRCFFQSWVKEEHGNIT